MTTKISSANIQPTGVTAGSYTTANVTVNSVGQVTTASSGTGGSGDVPKITNIQVTDNSYTVLDDTAVDTSGGYIKITGTGFAAGCQVLVNNIAATSTTFVSATEVRAQVPATQAGTYVVYLVNSDGGVAIRVNGITFSATPTWISGSTLTGNNNEAISIQLQATLAASYALASGSTLPAGLTLTSGGLLSGTITGLTQETVYSFSIVATDSENQDSPRTFTLTITVADPYYELVTLHLPGTGTNGATNNTFLDSSANNFAITSSGNTTQGTFSPFSQTGWSVYFDGSDDFINGNGNADFALGTGDFTIEMWFWANSVSSQPQLISFAPTSTNGPYPLIYLNSSGNLIYYVNNTAVITDSNVIVLNTWNHVVVARSGTSTKMFLNGTQVGNTWTDTSNYLVGTSRPTIGKAGYNDSSYLNGYVSNLRVVKGRAVYTSNFIPPTSTLGLTSGGVNPPQGSETKLLICQSNRFIDLVGTNITPNNGVTIVPFNPFAPTAAWSAQTNSGSGYFDGTGDYLRIAANTAHDFSTGDFTVELWIYPPDLTWRVYLSAPNNTTTQIGYDPVNWSNRNLYFYNGAVGNILNSTATAITINQWNHVVVVRSGSTISLFANGVRCSTATHTNSVSFSNMWIGTNNDTNQPYSGYMSGLRIIKGSAIYNPSSTTITVPTAPVTNITNTSLLLNFTNAAIRDATGRNDLETVGNSQISTAQSKWGDSSMAFDGTGDYLLTNSTPDLMAFGTGNFTFECWAYPTSLPAGTIVFIDYRPSGTEGLYPAIYFDSGVIKYYVNSADRITGSSLSVNNWYHIALSRASGSTRLFVNGTQVGSTYSDTNNYLAGSQRPAIATWGKNLGSNSYFGYIQDFRVTKGYARYTSNFTVPTAAFPKL